MLSRLGNKVGVSGNLRPGWLAVLLLATLVAVLAIDSSPAKALGPDAIRSGFDSVTLARNDDGSTPEVSIGFTADFFGELYDSVWVNNNGNLTLDGPMWTYTPFNIITTGRPIIAPFFGDVDTRVGGDPVKYGNGTVNGRPAFGATYANVDCYYTDASRTARNYFQVVLIDRADTGPGNFDIEFNYDQIQWETGEASGGSSACLGGSSARVGYSNGVDAAFELPGSAINGYFLDSSPTGLIHGSLNSGHLGRYIFNAREGEVILETAILTCPRWWCQSPC